MKTNLVRKAGLWVGLIGLVMAHSGCKKTESDASIVPVDLASRLLGNYQVRQIKLASLPVDVVVEPANVTVLAERNGTALDKVLLTTAYSYTINATAQVGNSRTTTIRLQLTEPAIDLYDQNQKIGSWKDGILELTDYSLNTERVTIKAIKQ